MDYFYVSFWTIESYRKAKNCKTFSDVPLDWFFQDSFGCLCQKLLSTKVVQIADQTGALQSFEYDINPLEPVEGMVDRVEIINAKAKWRLL